MARLLNTYQLWLDDLFPKAKFADGLSMLEKLGHKKRVQMMRREWIDEGKPRPIEEPEDDETPVQNETSIAEHGDDPDAPDITSAKSLPRERAEGYSASLQESAGQGAPPLQILQPTGDDPEGDELDALLAEGQPASNERPSLFGSGAPLVHQHGVPPDKDSFEDEEEAMANMDW